MGDKNGGMYPNAKIEPYGNDNKGFEPDSNIRPASGIPSATIWKAESNPDKPATIWSQNPEPPTPNPSSPPHIEDGRQEWDKPIEFLLSCIAMSVGLGNIWRFPFTALQNGGGAFLIPYFIVLILIGRPVYYMEMCMGQFSRRGQVQCWSLCPLFKGIGYATALATFCVATYYSSIMAFTVYYFFASFAKTVPWDDCKKSWGGDLCTDDGKLVNVNGSIAALYFTMEVFPQNEDLSHGLGMLSWKLALCLLFAWIVVFLSLWKGVESSGKVAYFTALFPYVVLLILLIRGCTLDGAGAGIEYFFKPQWSEIYKPKVWYAAVGQCFFSLSAGFGPIIMLSSHNPFKHNVYRDTLIVSVMDTFTSIIAGCTVFAVLGYLSKSTGLEINQITSGGMGLAFIAYPEAIATFGWAPQLFAVLFFLMLFTLGVGSLTALSGAIISVVSETFKNVNQLAVTAGVCLVGCLLGLMYVTEGGGQLIDLIDYFGANFIIYVLVCIQCAAICWIYGLNNFCQDIEFMIGIPVGIYWKVCWAGIVPVGLFIVFVYAMVEEDLLFPDIALGFGWFLAAFAIALVPAMGLHTILTRKSIGLKNKFLEALKPTEKWGPSEPTLRKEWLDFRKGIRGVNRL